MANPNMKPGMPSVNPKGRSVWKPLTDALKIELTAEPKRARRIARRLLQEAEDGNLEATKIIMDRLEGKPVQAVEIGEPGEFMGQDERYKRILELQGKALVEDAVTVPLLPTGVKER